MNVVVNPTWQQGSIIMRSSSNGDQSQWWKDGTSSWTMDSFPYSCFGGAKVDGDQKVTFSSLSQNQGNANVKASNQSATAYDCLSLEFQTEAVPGCQSSFGAMCMHSCASCWIHRIPTDFCSFYCDGKSAIGATVHYVTPDCSAWPSFTSFPTQLVSMPCTTAGTQIDSLGSGAGIGEYCCNQIEAEIIAACRATITTITVSR